MDLQTSINLLMFGAGLALVLMSISLFNTALRDTALRNTAHDTTKKPASRQIPRADRAKSAAKPPCKR